MAWGEVRAAVRDEEVVDLVRTTRPLVHCLVGAVSAPVVANGLLAAGVEPMMTDVMDDAAAMAAAADALLVNLGMLTPARTEAIQACVSVAADQGRPWVLDPVAVGHAPARTAVAAGLLARRPGILRANAMEVRALAGEGVAGHGPAGEDRRIPSGGGCAPLGGAAARLSDATGTVVAVSGEVDRVVTPGGAEHRIVAGHRLLTRVTGTGCLLGALMAACAAVSTPVTAARTATAWLGLAGERAAAVGAGPGSFAAALLDELASVTGAEVAETLRRGAR